MATNPVFANDEESLYHKVQIQPFSSTPRNSLGLYSFEDDNIGVHGKTQEPTSLSERLGLEELSSLETWRASIGELLGTATLVFALDTIYISSYESNTATPNIVEPVFIALIVTILILATSSVSGGHLNPIISFSAALVGLISMSRAAIYISAQCIGAVLGALALTAVVNNKIQNAFSLAGCTLSVSTMGPNGPTTATIETAPALWLEIICTFVLLFSCVWVAFDHRQAQAQARGPVSLFSGIGIVVGVLVFVSVTLTKNKGYAGVGMNPARCLGPAIVRGGLLWDRHWVFWVGPFIACVAFYMYTKVIPRQHFQAREFRYDIFTTLSQASRGRALGTPKPPA
ncbi:aquaporin-5-like [Macadamia integrifolia]|uniref:aquaporin-5-like n=1 Tax=Macadamia integrifolia TaxID=60698 RepID=UPI001C4E3A66|nr:aquaporin-5-like [Macadamia integrifolia]